MIQTFLRKVGVPYVIENVMGSPLTGTVICGSSFGLKVEGIESLNQLFLLSN